MSVARPVEVPRPQLAEAGLFLLLVAAPLVVTPFSASPFGDLKLVFLVGGTLCLWASGAPIDRRIGFLGLGLVAATLIAALTGVQVPTSLTAQAQSSGGGFVLIACCAALAAVGSALPADLRVRARWFLLAGGLAVGAIAIVFRVAPDAFDVVFHDRSLRGSTLGNPVFGAAFCAAAIAATLGHSSWAWRRRIVVVAILAFACATFEQRSALILPLVAGAATVWMMRLGRRLVVIVMGALLGAIVLFELIQPILVPLGTSGLGQLQESASDRARFIVWIASAEGWTERPLLGWGPGNTRSAYITGASGAQLDEAGRNWADAHNLVLESLVTSGVLGLVAVLSLIYALGVRALHADRSRAWAFGCATALGLFALVEPLNMVITPLFFFMMGVAAGTGADRTGDGVLASVRHLVTIAFAGCLVVTAILFAAATLERWGTTYGEIWALESSLDLQPWRLSAQRELAIRLSSDAAAKRPGAESEARAVIQRAVDDHPWDTKVRLWAAQVEHLMGNDGEAIAWIEEHVERFPADEPLLAEVRAALDDGFAIPDAGTATGSG